MGGAVSSGRDNNELIDNLMGGNYIRTNSVERVFRVLDRADYMTPEARDQAYKDMAWRNGPLHMSAPCIYSEVMEGLELRPGLSFLNVGSGTGYLSTLAGLVLGSGGISHGVEVHPMVVEYATKKLGQFIENSPTLDEFDFCEPRFYCGNGLCLAPLQAAYDRVYCGAGCPEEYQNYFKQLIKVGGVLVMPLNDNLVQVRRMSDNMWSSRNLLHVSFASLRVPTKDESADLLKLEELTPPRLQVLARSVVRAAMRRGLQQKHPALRAPPPRAPVARHSCPRRICIPIEDDSDVDGLDELHDLDPSTGANEMNALLSLVLSMRQNRVAGALRFDSMAVSDSDSSSSSDDDDDDDDDDIFGGHGGNGGGGGGGGTSRNFGGGGRGSGGGRGGGGLRGGAGGGDDRRRLGNLSGGDDSGDESSIDSGDGGGYAGGDGNHGVVGQISDMGISAGIISRLRSRESATGGERTGTLARFCRGILTFEYQNDEPDDDQPDEQPEPEPEPEPEPVEPSGTTSTRPRTKRPQPSETATRVIETRNRSAGSSAQSSQSDATRARPQIRAIRARIRARPRLIPEVRARPVTRSMHARTATSRTRSRPTPSNANEGTSKDTKNTNKTNNAKKTKSKTRGKDDSERALPSEVEIYLGSAKKSAGGSQSGGIEWEETESKILSSDEETKDVKRKKLDSGIGEETTSSSSSSPAKTEVKSEPTEAEAGSSQTFALMAGTDSITVIGRRRLVRGNRATGTAPASRPGTSAEPAGSAGGSVGGAASGAASSAASGAAGGSASGSAGGAAGAAGAAGDEAAGGAARRAPARRSRARAQAPARAAPGPDARRVRLSILMKRGVKELPLPYALKKYVNLGRCFQF